MVLFYTARDRESLELWCTTSKAWFILAYVIHHFLYWLAFLWVCYLRLRALQGWLDRISQCPQITRHYHFLYMSGIGGKDEGWDLSGEIRVIFRAALQMQTDVLCLSTSLQDLYSSKWSILPCLLTSQGQAHQLDQIKSEPRSASFYSEKLIKLWRCSRLTVAVSDTGVVATWIKRENRRSGNEPRMSLLSLL